MGYTYQINEEKERLEKATQSIQEMKVKFLNYEIKYAINSIQFAYPSNFWVKDVSICL